MNRVSHMFANLALFLVVGSSGALAQHHPVERERGGPSASGDEQSARDLSVDERQLLRRELREAQAERRLLRQRASGEGSTPGMSRPRGVEPPSMGAPVRGAPSDGRGSSSPAHMHRGHRLSESERQQLREQLRGYHGRAPGAAAAAPSGPQP